MKKALWVCLAISLVLLPACGGGEVEETPGPAEGEEPAEGVIALEFWYALSGSTGEAVEELVEQFNGSHPNIQVTATYQGSYGQIIGKVWNAIFAEQTLPHVAHLGGAPLVGETGAIVPITDFTDGSNGIDRSQVYDAFWDYNSAGGQTWSMPFNNSMPVLYYNRDLFAAAGLDPDSPPTTWDEVIEYGQVLTQDTDGNGEIDQWGFNTRDDTHWYLSTMFLENGVQIINAEQTEVLYNSPEAVEMLQLWGDMVNVHQIMPPGQHEEAKGDFLAGKLGMLLRSCAGIPSTAAEVTFDLGVATIPTIEGRDPVEPIGGGSLVIFRKDDAAILDAAWEFVKFMTSPEGSLHLSTHSGYLPIYKDVLEWPQMQTYLDEHPLQRVVIESLQYSYAIPIFPALGTSDRTLRRAVEAVELEASTPQDALDEAKVVVDKNIAEQH
ncbi:MAG: ABC transporter substrate-binding protein [Chloroflexota bacterium]|nr:ABC transporter substrate-binding protein [Chloroflexota bacterium]